MNHYIEFARDNDMKSFFLWSDIGCDYMFYNKYGFKKHKEFYHKYLPKNDKNIVYGFVYYYESYKNN